MNSGVGWRFPPTNGGISTGINDPGIAHFTGQPLASLARETIQNSLDACLNSDQPVHVSFELLEFNLDEVRRDELLAAIEACRSETADEHLSMEATALREAAQSVELKLIPCLRISDRNTTGLFGDNWRALVKMQGFSHKPDMEGAGGSHGSENMHRLRSPPCEPCSIGLVSTKKREGARSFRANQFSYRIAIPTERRLKEQVFLE